MKRRIQIEMRSMTKRVDVELSSKVGICAQLFRQQQDQHWIAALHLSNLCANDGVNSWAMVAEEEEERVFELK